MRPREYGIFAPRCAQIECSKALLDRSQKNDSRGTGCVRFSIRPCSTGLVVLRLGKTPVKCKLSNGKFFHFNLLQERLSQPTDLFLVSFRPLAVHSLCWRRVNIGNCRTLGNTRRRPPCFLATIDSCGRSPTLRISAASTAPLSAPSRKCMNSADLSMLRFRRSFFLASIVSDGLLRFVSRHFNDLDDIR